VKTTGRVRMIQRCWGSMCFEVISDAASIVRAESTGRM
jgi:hypothetical protein